MQVQRVNTARPYDVHIGVGALDSVADFLDSFASAALIADERVFELHGSRLGALQELPRVLLTGGEDCKRFTVLEDLLNQLVGIGLERGSALVLLGGGTITDVGGLAAALFQRGIPYLSCPTTLLAQVDASVGGKTAVNLREGKNLAGCFHQPAGVWIDPELLATLSEEEYQSGLGEVLKSALIAGESAFAKLELKAADLTLRHTKVVESAISDSVRIKADIVARDELERGSRAVLNLGHTFAHAVEQVAGFGRIPHGIAVAAGLGSALEFSRRQGVLRSAGLQARTAALSESLGLPTGLAELRERYSQCLPAEQLIQAMARDKKSRSGRPEFVLVRDLGEILPAQTIRDDEAHVLLELLGS